MRLCFGIKILCDLSLYFIYAQLICHWLGAPVDARGALALLALAGGLSCLLRSRGKLRFLPLALVPACLWLMPGVAGAAVLLAPAAYLAVTAARRLYRIEHGDCCDAFRRGCVLLLPLLVLPMFGLGGLVARVALPMAVVYLSCGVLLLRMLRHEPAVLSQPRFIALNSLMLALVLAAAAAFSSPVFLGAVGAGFGWLYRNLVMPPLMLLGYVAAGFMWVCMQAIQWLSRGKIENGESEIPQIDMQNEPLFGENEVVETPEFLQALFTTLFIVICAVAAWWFFRRLLGRRAREESGPAVAETRGLADASPRGERPPRLRPRDPRGAVRWDYRRFLILCRRVGIVMPRAATTETAAELGRQDLPGQPIEELSEVYRVARYSEHEITREMADKTHSAVREIRRRIPKV